MKFATARFAISLALFLVWLGWLLRLAISTANPIVLYEPQFLVSGLDVIAHIDSVNGNEIEVREVVWPSGDPDKLVGKKLRITNLDQCKDDWHGTETRYILPLTPDGKDAYRVVLLPRSPTFAGGAGKAGRPHIYPATPQTLMQLDKIQKPQAIVP